MNDGILNNAFIDIFPFPDIQLFHIDKVQKIFILKGADCSECLLCRGKRLYKVIRQTSLMVIVIAGNTLAKLFIAEHIDYGFLYIEQSLILVLDF